ncbi:hypothetical protein [uncultured Sphaerochaeta sp.]|uniref:hypothetical protein n=1 Tax=uncultured Sphaerochaeta sp. TaxID=886478 RepID=UPI002A0A77A6|nr:hypothetical protein [uncultured Sphaerochaeta sp.]
MNRMGVRKIMFCITLFMFFCILSPNLAFSAITLSTAETKVRFLITPATVSFSGTKIPIGDVSLEIKQKGPGKVMVMHSPLSNGTKVVDYILSYEMKGKSERSDSPVFHYSENSTTLKTIHITTLDAELRTSFSENPKDYTSNIVLNVILER